MTTSVIGAEQEAGQQKFDSHESRFCGPASRYALCTLEQCHALGKMLQALRHSIWAQIVDRCGRMGTGGGRVFFSGHHAVGKSLKC